MQAMKCDITESQNMAQCRSLKELVEAMQATGLFEVFSVSKGEASFFSTRAPKVSFWASVESARTFSDLLIDQDGRTCIPGYAWRLDAGFPRTMPEDVVCSLSCARFNEDEKSLWKSIWRFIVKRQEVDRGFSILRDFVVLNFQKGNQEEHRKKESSDQHA